VVNKITNNVPSAVLQLLALDLKALMQRHGCSMTKGIDHLHHGHDFILLNLRNLRKVRRSWKHLQKKSDLPGWPQAALRYPEILKVVEIMQDPEGADDSQDTEAGICNCQFFCFFITNLSV
jgi:hypothetical protein